MYILSPSILVLTLFYTHAYHRASQWTFLALWVVCSWWIVCQIDLHLMLWFSLIDNFNCCREQISNGLNHSGFGDSGRSDKFKLSFSSNTPYKASLADWWVEDLSVLRIDFYQRVLAALRSKGMRGDTIGAALMHYAHHSLKGLKRKQNVRSEIRPPKIKVFLGTCM